MKPSDKEQKQATDFTPEEGSQAFFVELESFQGPLDLLLHLIKKHEMNVFDIPILEITEKYLEYARIIEELDLDQAGDFILMAATLAHIKSRMLLPPDEAQAEEEEEENDPREELVRRLLEYQSFKDAADRLSERPMLGRDEFARAPDYALADSREEVDIEEVSAFALIEIFQEILERTKENNPHEVQMESVSVEERITVVLRALSLEKRVTFRSLFTDVFTRSALVATFLGILELARLRVLRLYQAQNDGEIYLARRPDAPRDEDVMKRLSASSVDIEEDGAAVS